MIETLASVAPGSEVALRPLAARGTAAPADFSTWLTRELSSVNEKLQVADTHLRKLAVGEATNIHETMIALENAKLSFELVVQVRNRILEAYQDVLRMQI